MSVRPEVLDFALCSIQLETCPRAIKKQLGQRLIQALERDACVYLINTGLPEDKVQAVNDVVEKFFGLPEKKKLEYAQNQGDIHGFANIHMERVVDSKTAAHPMEDYFEAFNVILSYDQTIKKWPDDVLPDFKPLAVDLINHYHTLSNRCFELCALGLQLENEDAFKKYHNFDSLNTSGLRFINYLPKVTDDLVPLGTQRLPEHKDFSSLTFLLQDHIEGFQMKFDGIWKDLECVPGAMLVICGEAMEGWTAGRLKAIEHRVMWPKDLALQNQLKFTHGFFAHADEYSVIKPIDGSDTFHPRTVKEALATYISTEA